MGEGKVNKVNLMQCKNAVSGMPSSRLTSMVTPSCFFHSYIYSYKN